MEYTNPDALVSTEWLAEHLDAADVRVVDATWFLPSDGRKGADIYNEGHIPGAVFFDIDEISDTDSALPHMLPSSEKFSSRVSKLGLGGGVRIIVYDANGGYMAACRVWWMFQVFGHKDVAVLDGGLPQWKMERRSTDGLNVVPQQRHFTACKNNFMVRSLDQMLTNCRSGKEQVIDVRSPGRFNGIEEEPRGGMRKGHIPDSINVPVPMIMDPAQNFLVRPAADVKANMDAAGLDPKRPLVASCGSGVTACVVGLGLYLIGYKEVAIYDGSWSEWGSRKDTPVALD